MGSLVAQDNRTTPLLVLQCVNWATTDRENREVNRKSKIYRIDIQQRRVPFAFNCTIWDVIFQILKIYSIYTKRATFLYWSRSWQLKYYMITNICTWCSCNFFRERGNNAISLKENVHISKTRQCTQLLYSCSKSPYNNEALVFEKRKYLNKFPNANNNVGYIFIYSLLFTPMPFSQHSY